MQRIHTEAFIYTQDRSKVETKISKKDLNYVIPVLVCSWWVIYIYSMLLRAILYLDST